MNSLPILAETHLTAIETERLVACETIVERGLNTFYEVGKALMEIRDSRLYREQHGTFEEYCQRRWHLSRPQAYRLIDASDVFMNLSPIGDIPANESQVRPLVPLQPEEQQIVWQVVQDTAPEGKITASHVKSVVEVLKEITTTGAIDPGDGVQVPASAATTEHLKAAVTEETYERMKRQETYIAEKQNGYGKPRGVPPALLASTSNEWYTPVRYLGAVRAVMGGIDVDPASNDIANEIVQAATYYTLETNGFDKDWRGRVFMNPPYGFEGGDSNQELWSARLVEQFETGITTEAILLVNAVTDRKWFQPLWNYTICFTDHRIRFYNSAGEFGFPTHGNAFVYFGDNANRFVEVFQQFGVIARRIA